MGCDILFCAAGTCRLPSCPRALAQGHTRQRPRQEMPGRTAPSPEARAFPGREGQRWPAVLTPAAAGTWGHQPPRQDGPWQEPRLRHTEAAAAGRPGPRSPRQRPEGGQSGHRRVTAPAGRGLAAGLAETELFFEARRTAFGPPPPAACGKGPQGASAVVVPGPGGGLGPVSCRVCHRPPTGEPRIFPLTSPSVA